MIDKLKPYRTLDFWRGLACLAVVLYHEGALLTARYPPLGTLLLYRAGAHGNLGVQMFFVISGYCIAGAACAARRRGERCVSFLHARVRRVYPPLWYSLALFFLFSLLATALVASGRLPGSALADLRVLHQTPLYYLSNLTLTQLVFHTRFLSPVCWTLCYEMAFYVIVSLFLVRPATQGRTGTEEASLLTSLHALTLGTLALLILAPQLHFFPLDLWPQLGLGALVFDVLRHPHQARPKRWLLAAGLETLLFLATRSLTLSVQREPSRPTFALSLAFSLLLLLLYRYDDALSRVSVVRVFSTIGLFSYSLYLTHLLTLGLVNQSFRRVPLPASAHPLILIVCILACVGVARLFFQFCERPFVPALRRSKEVMSKEAMPGQHIKDVQN